MLQLRPFIHIRFSQNSLPVQSSASTFHPLSVSSTFLARSIIYFDLPSTFGTPIFLVRSTIRFDLSLTFGTLIFLVRSIIHFRNSNLSCPFNHLLRPFIHIPIPQISSSIQSSASFFKTFSLLLLSLHNGFFTFSNDF